MQFATITSLLAVLSASSSSSKYAAAFVPRPPVSPKNSALQFAHRVGPDGGREHVVTFTNTAHREEIHLETMSGAQLSQFYDELEALTAACTEEATQTHPLCDVELKDERDAAMLQITTLLQEREKDRLTNDVDMESIRTMIQTPWTHSFATIEGMVARMEALQWECTEEGNQTKPSCDVILKDERDRAIETLNMYMTAIRQQVSQEEHRQQQAATQQARKQAATKKQARSPVLPVIAPVVVTKRSSTPAFALETIRKCVKTPGSHNMAEMHAMVAQLEAQQLLCTEDGTQTNAECDLDIKAERDGLMEALGTHITEATSSLKNGIQKAVVAEHENHTSLDPMLAMKEVMATVIPTRPNLTPLTNITTTQKTSTRSKTTTTSVAAIRNIHHSNDDSLVQI